jgi:hypothetical protein
MYNVPDLSSRFRAFIGWATLLWEPGELVVHQVSHQEGQALLVQPRTQYST